MEEWRNIEGFDYYQVSSEGRIRSLDHEVERYNHGVLTKHHYKGKVLRPAESTCGYLQVNLCQEGKHHYKRIHRLVAKAFIPNPDNFPQVNHKNEDKHDNRVQNLEWCSSEYNSNYGTRNERSAKAKSKQVGQFSIDWKLIKVWPSTAEAGRNGFDKGSVSACCLGKQQTHKSFKWQYIN